MYISIVTSPLTSSLSIPIPPLFPSSHLLPKQPPHPLQHAILLRVVRMVLARYLEQARKRSRVALDAVAYLVGDVLVDEQDGNVFALRSEAVEGGLDRRVGGFGV
jgi:hypothetical protein